MLSKHCLLQRNRRQRRQENYAKNKKSVETTQNNIQFNR